MKPVTYEADLARDGDSIRAARISGLLEAAAICRERAETINKYTVVSASEDRNCAAAIERRAKKGTP